MSNYQNQKLLNLAKGQPCTRCRRNDGTTVSAHSNQLRHGKGRSIKAHDCYVAWLCYGCHMELDQGRKMSKQERIDEWEKAHEITYQLMRRMRLIEGVGTGDLLDDWTSGRVRVCR